METAENGDPPARGGSFLLVLITAVLCLALGAGGAFFFLRGDPETLPPDEAEAVESTEEAGGDPAEEFSQRLLSLEPMIVNITGDGYARLLKIRVELECESPEVRQEAEARVAQIHDGILTLVSSKRLSEVTAFEGKALLKEELQSRFNQLLTTGRVDAVLLTEFVVQ